MARPKKDQLKREIRERNGVFYAYTSTSTMENGKKVTKTTYEGKWDPVTEKVIPKKARGKYRSKKEIAEARKELTIKDIVEGIETKEYGSVYLLDQVQHRSRLGHDLWASFGEASRGILGAAMALCLHRGSFMDIEDTMARSMICQFYGLKNRYASQEMSEFTHQIGLSTSNIDTFFERRVKKCEGVISWDSTTIGTWAKDNGLADYVKNNKDNEDIPQIKKAFASDSRGIPVMYEIYPGTMSDIATMEAFVKRIQRYDSRDVIFVMDRGYESGAGLKFLQSSGARFVLPAKIQGPALKSLLTDFKKPVQKTMYFDNHAYSVWETEIGLRESGRKLTDGRNAWEFVRLEQTDNEPLSAKENLLTVKAFVCHDTESYSDEIQNFRMMLRDISARLDAIDSPDPMTAFKEATGKASKYFDAKPNGRKIEYRLKENAISFKENRAGTFIMLTSPEMTWDQMMSAYDARRLVEQNFDTDKTLYGRFGTRDPVTIQGREFIRFVSLILRCELTRMLRDNEHTESVDNVLNSVGAISAMGRDKEWFVKNVGKKHRILFGDLNLEIPDEVETDMQIFTQEEVDEPQPDV